ncbi:MAG: riboflavin synthase [Cytophagaceae bacterium]|nr:riboflavin synthase [Cytophagaceae bacterium]
MFTGIIEVMGKVVGKRISSGNIEFEIESIITPELNIDQSVSHNGVCLTVTNIKSSVYTVTAIQETLRKSNLSELNIGDFVNLERSMPANGRFDGHIVQGHVDQVGICSSIKEDQGSHIFTFNYEEKKGCITVEKGSITVNGISLTVINSLKNQFSVAIIPFTFQHTNLQFIKLGDKVNLEFDVLGKYVQRILEK